MIPGRFILTVMDCLNRPGYDIEIKARPAPEPVGHLTLVLT
jgi:hypothetical protein